MTEKRVDVSQLDNLDFWKVNGQLLLNPQKIVNIPPEARLDIYYATNGFNTQSVPVRTRSGITQTLYFPQTGTMALDGRVFAYADVSALNISQLQLALVPRDQPVQTWAGFFPPNQQTQGFTTSVDFKTLAPTLVTNGTTITTGTAGANNVGPGNRVYYSLCVSNPNTTAADVAASVGLYGHTSGKIYAICLAGASVSGYFDMTQTAEKIDINYTNPDSVDHTVAGSYSAVSP